VVALAPDCLQDLPEDLCNKLHNTVLRLDVAKTREVIQNITPCDASLGASLGTLAENMGYDRLLALFGVGGSQCGTNR
jgi:hypothetical protein